ncbi:sodium- and chloride-dependent glycine transporter 2-like [Tubulanus polymorphus]|uniref:sodium- and chloride-dependent glycine transporter 2-like n=1 Tax=Tubulanus polymorphus TaxID=672921 RepID=UPI003DA45EC2
MKEIVTTCCNEMMVEEDCGKGDNEKPKAKEQWGKEIDFFLSCIGYAVGLGNVWRFPYLCMRNGGGAFLIPYFTFMLIAGVPLYFIELSIGQYSGKSPLAVFDLCPLFSGLGYAMLITSLICTVYYNMIISWILYYIGMSFTSWNPVWGSCENSWNTENCRESVGSLGLSSPNSTVFNETLHNVSYISSPNHALYQSNFTANHTNLTSKKYMSSGEEFWQYNVLELTDRVEDLGGLRWQLVLCHTVGWLIVFACLCKGVRSSGKVVYVTATTPYLFLVILLIRGVTLPGSTEGILYYIKPDWRKLLTFDIWAEACLQIFYSLGPAWGGILTMASYNKFSHNIYRDSVLIPVITCGTSFFAGFVIFSVIGFMAHEANVSIEEAVTSGPGLAFIAYPMALAKIPGAPVWSVLFFLMLLTIGLDSQFVTFETVLSGFTDRFPKLRKKQMLFTIGAAVINYLLGLLFCTRGGMYWFQLVDWYIAVFTLITVGILECLVVSYLYGLDRLYDDIAQMIGYRPSVIWKACWGFFTPLILLVFLTYVLVVQVAPSYGDYHYPTWAIGFGWCIALVSAVPIPVFMVIELYKRTGSLKERLQKACRPAESWGPNIDLPQQKQLLEMADIIRKDEEIDCVVKVLKK